MYIHTWKTIYDTLCIFIIHFNAQVTPEKQVISNSIFNIKCCSLLRLYTNGNTYWKKNRSTLQVIPVCLEKHTKWKQKYFKQKLVRHTLIKMEVTFLFSTLIVGLFYVSEAQNNQQGLFLWKYKVDVNTVISSRRLLVNYINCLLDKGPCTAEATELKSKYSYIYVYRFGG